MDWLVDPLTAPYMQRALAMLVLLSLPAGALGLLTVLRGNVFTAHALGNGAFPGTVAAVALGVDAFAGALAAALAMGVLIAILQRRTGVDPAVATALALVGALALGSWLVSQLVEVNRSVDTVLFGSLLGITDADLWRAAVVTIVALAAVAALWRGWLIAAFDRTNASALGVRPVLLDLLFLLVLALTVVTLVDAVGALLVSSFLVVPAATARLVVGRMIPLMLCSSALALGLSVVGLLVSYWFDAPPGATIAALAAAVFALAAAVLQLRSHRAGRPVVVAACLTALVLAAAGCGGSDESGGAALQVVGTTPQVADWVREVGGDRVAVTQILPPNIDPHDFEPSPSDADAVGAAAVVFSSGVGLDEWAGGLVESSGSSGILVEVAPDDDLIKGGEEEGHDHGGLDPHFWHDPTLVKRAVDAITAELVKTDPDGAEGYEKRAANYKAELDELDAELTKAYGAVPAADRKMVTDHDAFGYLARRYDITVVGTVIPSLSTAAEPSARETAALIDRIKEQGVCAVFSESSVDPKLAKQVAEESGATIYPDLYGDSLGPQDSDGATYLGMMRHNQEVLVKGFRCQGS